MEWGKGYWMAMPLTDGWLTAPLVKERTIWPLGLAVMLVNCSTTAVSFLLLAAAKMSKLVST